MALALREEGAGDPAGAERHLLHATALDATFAPRWALINFYMRQGRSDEFWRESADAVRRYEADLSALFRLAIAEGGVAPAWARLQPRRPAAQRQFLDLLLAGQDFPSSGLIAAGDAAAALAGHGRAKDRDQLLSYCERVLLEGKVTGPAVKVWNAMADAGLHRLGTLDVAAGRVLTNGDFRERPAGSGFDWRIPEVPGSSAHRAGGGGLAMEITAIESGETALLRQVLPLAAGERYRVRTRFRKVRGDAAGGLRWRVGSQVSGLFTEWADRDGVVEGSWDFGAAGGGPAVLELWLAREAGRGAPVGSIVIEEVRAEAAGGVAAQEAAESTAAKRR
jgi:hypothetical protein